MINRNLALGGVGKLEMRASKRYSSKDGKRASYKLALLQSLRTELRTTNHRYQKLRIRPRSDLKTTDEKLFTKAKTVKDQNLPDMPEVDSVIVETTEPQVGRNTKRSQLNESKNLPTLPSHVKHFLFRSRGSNAGDKPRTYSLGKPLFRSLGGSQIRKRTQKTVPKIGSMLHNIFLVGETNKVGSSGKKKFKLPKKYGGYFHKYEYIEDPGKRKEKIIKNFQYYKRR